MLPLRYAAALTLVAAAVTAAGAQQTTVAPDQIPKELALALIGNMNEGGDFLVGALPPDLAHDMTVPAGARVLGSFVSPFAETAVLTTPSSADSARAALVRTLVEHGWTVREPNRPMMGGLVFGPRPSAIPGILCKPGAPETLTISVPSSTPRSTLVRIVRSRYNTLCDQLDQRADPRQLAAMRSYAFSTVPPLYAPGDYRAVRQGCGTRSGSNADTQGQVLRSELDARGLLASFGQQLDSAGWRPASADSGLATAHWSKSIGTRGVQYVELTVAGMPNTPGCYTVTLSATRLPEEQ